MPVTTQEHLQFIVRDAPSSTIEDPLIRMQEDLKRALKKPVEQRRWVMLLDLRKCVGCSACTIACIAENKLPPGVVYRPVLEEEIGTYPNVTRRFVPRPCMQCDNPPCVNVCPVNATYKRPDGIVAINYDDCIGCRYCITACPYSARTFDSGRFTQTALRRCNRTKNSRTLNTVEPGIVVKVIRPLVTRASANSAPIGSTWACCPPARPRVSDARHTLAMRTIRKRWSLN